MRSFTASRSSPRKRGPSAFVKHNARDGRQGVTGDRRRPQNWVPAFAGMSGEENV